METVRDFIFLGSKITADSDTAKKFKDAWLLERKAMINLDSIFKSRDITLPTKVHLVKTMGFLVVMWELDHKEGWAPKNWCFWTAVLEKTLMNPLDCTRPNQSILKEIHPEYSLEGINSMDMGLTKFWETVNVREAWHAAIHGVTKSWTQLRDWTITSAFLVVP